MDNMSWGNLLLAGNFALDLFTTNSTWGGPDGGIYQWMSPDVDLFFYGLQDPEYANQLVKHLWQRYLVDHGENATMNRNTRFITFTSKRSFRVNITLRLFKSGAEVLSSFDFDDLALGFDGRDVIVLPRCALALETGSSILIMDTFFGNRLGAAQWDSFPLDWWDDYGRWSSINSRMPRPYTALISDIDPSKAGNGRPLSLRALW